jgi:ABC-2 type transport system ATP-binding protein
MTVPAIVVRGLEVRFGRHRVLRGLDLSVASGSTTALLGPNGAGKSTLLRACLGVVRPTGGSIRILGLDPACHGTRARRLLGYVPDAPDVWPWMTVSDLFRFLAPHHPTWDPEVAWGTVERLGVPARTPLGRMSRGEGMKAMLAAALAHHPPVLLLDEPFAGLDPLVREEVLRDVVGALGEEGRTVLVATHDLDVAARVADRVAVLAGGEIRREGPVDQVGIEARPSPVAACLHRALALAVQEED